MKAVTCCLIAFLICNAECGRKVVQPLDRRANDDFIKMEGGGGVRPAAPAAAAPAVKPGGGAQPSQAVTPPKPQPQPAVTPPKPQPQSAVTPPKPQPQPAVTPPKPQLQPAVTLPKPSTQAVAPAKPAAPLPVQPARQPAKPAPSAPAAPAATPGPGSVQQLINYYDSRGQGSPIRPYTYSQAVKRGKA